MAEGVSAYVGDGSNRWTAVHNVDVARLYRLVLESRSDQPRFYAVAGEAVPFRTIAEVIGHQLSLLVVSLTPTAATKHFGSLTIFVQTDMPAASVLTHEWLGWHPKGLSLQADIDRPAYFEM